MKKQVVAFLFAWQCFAVFSQATSCDCKKGSGYYEELGAITNPQGHKIQVCGNKNEGKFMCDSLHTDFIIHDCLTGDTLFMPDLRGEDPYILNVEADKISVVSVISFGNEKKTVCLKINKVEIGLFKNKATISDEVPLLGLDPIPKNMLDDAVGFYNMLEDTLKTLGPHEWLLSWHPDNYLLLCALENVGRSRELFRNLSKYFQTGDSLAEEYSPNDLDVLLNNMVKK